MLDPTVSVARSQGVSLRTTETHDTFARCAAKESLKPGNVFSFRRLLYSGMDQIQGPQVLAFVVFEAATQNGTAIFLKMTFQTVDSAGWQFVQAPGEIYPFSDDIKTKALVVEKKTGSVLGSRDISACLN